MQKELVKSGIFEVEKPLEMDPELPNLGKKVKSAVCLFVWFFLGKKILRYG